jgi:hypothetical protein
MVLQTGMIAINNFADFWPRLRFGADLIQNEALGAGIIELVKEPGRHMHRLVLLQLEFLAILQTHHGAFALNHKKGVVRSGVAV